MSIVRRMSGATVALTLVALLASTAAVAGPGCGTLFDTAYPDSATQTLGGCQTCHQSSGGGNNFNVYGQDLLDNGANGAGFSCGAVDFVAVLSAVEGFDSDSEGNSNRVEIDAGTQPGWCVATSGSNCVNSAGTPPDVLLDPVAMNTPPVADAGGPYSGEAGTSEIRFDGSASSDADGDTLSFAWEFGDGSTASGMTPAYVYPAAGTYEVRLVVSDSSSSSEPSVTSATISAPPMNIAPIADPGGPYAGEPGQPIEFNGSASSDPNDDALTYVWDFGDGAMGDGVAPLHSYAADGTYTVTLTVDDGQVTDMATTTATIETAPANRAPTADAGGPYNGVTGETVSFNGEGSRDPDGDALTFTWAFGDGTMADGASPDHAYAAAGTYEVVLTVSDGEFVGEAVTSATITDPVAAGDTAELYQTYCASCHGDPWAGPAADDALLGIRRVAGARACNIAGSIFGTSVFPNGVPEMQFLQGLSEAEIVSIAEYLNSRDSSGEQRYVTTCAGCHGSDGSGGRVDEDVHGDTAGETFEAIAEEGEMHYLACMPESDIVAIAEFLAEFDDDNDDDGIADDEDVDDDNDGINDDDDIDDDNDGLSDDDEREYGTDARDEDSDDDGVDDGDEREDGTDPLDSDTDDDGLDDGEERDLGTDPMDGDSDDDGVGDGDEVMLFGTDPLLANNTESQSADTGGGGSSDLPLLILLAAAALLRGRQETIEPV